MRSAVRDGSIALALTALDLWTDDELVSATRKAFARETIPSE
ncbi:MAG: hypothetical protein R2698_11490 [Microthrixaceae bacterium]